MTRSDHSYSTRLGHWLAAIAIPKFGNLMIRSKESSVKAKLGAFRSAIAIYSSDAEGFYPLQRDVLVPRYIEEIPTIQIPAPVNHPPSAEVGSILDDWAGAEAWFYETGTGSLAINCTHVDSRGGVWSSF